MRNVQISRNTSVCVASFAFSLVCVAVASRICTCLCSTKWSEHFVLVPVEGVSACLLSFSFFFCAPHLPPCQVVGDLLRLKAPPINVFP